MPKLNDYPGLFKEIKGICNMLKKILISLVLFSIATPAFSQTYVRGYYRNNGTYVQPHYRSSPDSSILNNWSTKGNINPYTGKEGTKNPYLDYSVPNNNNSYLPITNNANQQAVSNSSQQCPNYDNPELCSGKNNYSNYNKTYFTIGSTKNEVLAVQGQPDTMMRTMWWYGSSFVSFENDKVRGYSNKGNLKIKVNNIN